MSVVKAKFKKGVVFFRMIEKGYTAQDLAEKVGMTKVAVNMAIAGRSFPKIGTIKKICETLDLLPSEALEITDEKRKPKKKK
jgi:DNA-binding Xre family transcriptional regulator